MKPADALLATLRDFGGDEFAFRAMGAFHEYLRQRQADVLQMGHTRPFGIDVTGPKSHEWAEAFAGLRDDILAAVERGAQ